MTILVGRTGFVGSNLYEQFHFDAAFHSKDIENAYGTQPDLLVYAGLRAEKFLANNAPEQDKALIIQAEENIRKIAPKNVVLISTVDVFKVPKNVDENSAVQTDGLHPYGLHRYQLEQWVREQYPQALIIRLPALYGKNIKKNFIYDMIQFIPAMLTAQRMDELCQKDDRIKPYYQLQENGFYQLQAISPPEHSFLKKIFEKIGFSALQFTDSRSKFQFYPLRRLWSDIQILLDKGVLLWHPATEPVSAGELYAYVFGKRFVNELSAAPLDYDYKTGYAGLFSERTDYICDKTEILADIKKFIEECLCQN